MASCDLEDALGAGLVGEQARDVPGERRVVRPARRSPGECGRLARLVLAAARRPPPSPSSAPRPSDARRSSSSVDPLLDALERLDDVALETDQHADRVFVGAAADLVGVAVGVADDHAALGLGRLGQAALVDEEGGLLLGPGDDPLGLLLGLLDDPLALGVDPLGGADLFGDGDAQLVDEAERRVLVDDDVRRQRQLLAVGDERFEALDEEDDVDRSALQAADGWGPCRPAASMARGRRRSAPREGLGEGRPRPPAGTIVDTSPPNAGDLLDQARADVAVARPRS